MRLFGRNVAWGHTTLLLKAEEGIEGPDLINISREEADAIVTRIGRDDAAER